MLRYLVLPLFLCSLSGCNRAAADAAADQKAIAERFLRGLYGCEPSVVSELAADSVAVSYPVFEELFHTPAIRGRANVEQFARGFCDRWKVAEITVHEALADHDRVVLVWSTRARNVASGEDRSWGGITLYRFDSAGRIAAETGEESSPGPVERLSVPAEEP